MANRRSARTAARTAHLAVNESVKRRFSEPASSDDIPRKQFKKSQPANDSHKMTVASIHTKKGNNELDKAGDGTESATRAQDELNAEKKWKSWSAYAKSTPYPDFGHPTSHECQLAYDILYKLHNTSVEAEFLDSNTPETIPVVLDALIVAILSQATGWSNAKRAMESMKETYGSVFAYQDIYSGGPEKLQETLRCGGLHVRKTKIIMSLLEEVRRRYGGWDLDHLLQASDEDAMKELISYKYVGPKSAFVVMDWCLKRNRFVVDTHVYRIAGLWGWRPREATREKTQSHLDAVIPVELKFKLHFLLIQHGRTCPACRGGVKSGKRCAVQAEVKSKLEASD